MVKIAFQVIPEKKQSLKEIIMAFATSGIFIHCEIHFSDGSVGYSDSHSGVVLKSIEDRVYNENWIYYQVPCNTEQEEIMKKYFIENAHLKYNLTGIIGNMITGLNIDFMGGQFCSQICFNAMVKAGVMKKYNFHPSEISPTDLQAIVQKINWKLCKK